MSAEELFRLLTLESFSMSMLQAQLHQGNEARTAECNAHVEFQLTPTHIEGSAPAQFALQVRLSCVGTPVRGTPRNKLFELELRATALYRQHAGEALQPNDFATHHTIFARQLFPTLVTRAQAMLQELGLYTIRLPLDLPQQLTPANQGPVVLN